MTTRDSALVQIKKNREVMRGLPEDSPTWKMLNEQNQKLGQVGVEHINPERAEKWLKVANILSELTYGEGQEYNDLEPQSIYRSLIAQEVNRIFKILE